jgi:hypothetical protein
LLQLLQKSCEQLQGIKMKKLFQKAIFAAAVSTLCQNAPLYARQPYHATLTVSNKSAKVSDSNLIDLNRDLKQSSIEKLLPIYTPTSPISLALNLRGVLADAAFPANSTVLTLTIPQAGITQTFDGGSRDASFALMKQFIRDGGSKSNLLRAYYKRSPIDPIAGNPDSLLAQMGKSDYLLGRLSPLSGCDCSWSAQPIVHQFQLGLWGGRSYVKGFDTTTVTLPLRYSYSPDHRWAFIIDAPFTYFRNGGASSVQASVGVGLRVPVLRTWSLTPILRAGTGGSLDLCTSGNFVSAGVASEIHGEACGWVLSMTNYAGYYTSANFWLTGINFNYRIQNFTIKNGLWFNSCKGFTFCKRPFNLGVSFVDTVFTKKLLYIRHYDEVGVSFITTEVLPWANYDCLTLGFSYRFGQKSYKGFNIDLTYQF